MIACCIRARSPLLTLVSRIINSATAPYSLYRRRLETAIIPDGGRGGHGRADARSGHSYRERAQVYERTGSPLRAPNIHICAWRTASPRVRLHTGDEWSRNTDVGWSFAQPSMMLGRCSRYFQGRSTGMCDVEKSLVTGALTGLYVINMIGVVAGLLAGQTPGDLGAAAIIKVERLERAGRPPCRAAPDQRS